MNSIQNLTKLCDSRQIYTKNLDFQFVLHAIHIWTFFFFFSPPTLCNIEKYIVLWEKRINDVENSKKNYLGENILSSYHSCYQKKKKKKKMPNFFASSQLEKIFEDSLSFKRTTLYIIHLFPLSPLWPARNCWTWNPLVAIGYKLMETGRSMLIAKQSRAACKTRFCRITLLYCY